jgi:hypothetical protein
MTEGAAPCRRQGLHWPGLVMSLVFLAVASVGFTGDPFWLLNNGTKWMIAAVVALIGMGMLVSSLPRRRGRARQR